MSIHFHKWTDWKDYKQYVSEEGGRMLLIQKRICVRCGKAQLRKEGV